MAQLLIRNLPDEAKEALRTRASGNGRSMEAEARAILVDIILPRADDPVLLWLGDAAGLRDSGEAIDLPEVPRQPSRDIEPL
jgi:plasmid stability protein